MDAGILTKFHRTWATEISTVSFVGHIKKAPGTWGSLVGILALFGLHHGPKPVEMSRDQYTLVLALICFIVGYFSILATEKLWGVHDPKQIVIDEVAGVWVAALFIPVNVVYYASAFILFRIFDIWKPWPVSYFDKHVPTAFGTIFDDIVAGLLSMVALHAILKLWSL